MENFIEEVLEQLIEDAIKLKEDAVNDFEKGNLFGYYMSISKILNQAEAFGVFEKLPENLKKFNPESLISGIK